MSIDYECDPASRTQGAPSSHCGPASTAADGVAAAGGPFTTVESTPTVAEKPYITIDSAGKYQLQVAATTELPRPRRSSSVPLLAVAEPPPASVTLRPALRSCPPSRAPLAAPTSPTRAPARTRARRP